MLGHDELRCLVVTDVLGGPLESQQAQPGFPLRQIGEDTDPKSQIPKDFRFRVSDFLGSESRKLAQIQKSKASRNQFLGSRQISWDVRFQISSYT